MTVSELEELHLAHKFNEPKKSSAKASSLVLIKGSYWYSIFFSKVKRSMNNSSTTSQSKLKILNRRAISRQRAVSFDLEATRIHFAEKVTDLSAQDVKARWYDSKKLDLINYQNKVSANFMRLGLKNPELRGHCFRGLEHLDDDSGNKRTVMLKKTLAAVLAEQQRQRDENVMNHDLLAPVYEKYSKLCCGKAVLMAKLDESLAWGFASPEETCSCDTELVSKPKSSSMSSSGISSPSVPIDVGDDDEISELSEGKDGLCSLDLDIHVASKRLFGRMRMFLRRKGV